MITRDYNVSRDAIALRRFLGKLDVNEDADRIALMEALVCLLKLRRTKYGLR